MSDTDDIEMPSDPAEEPGDGNTDGQGAAPSPNGQAEMGVAMTMAEYDELQQALDTARAEADKYRDSWQRAMADYNNLRRRTEQEREAMRGDLTGKILNPFLDVMDDLALAVQNRPMDDAENGWGAGIELVYRKLLARLESQGVCLMEVEGEEFDPHFHEAVTHEPSDEFESGTVIAAIKPGYMIGDKVLRPALVRVAA